MVDRFAEDWRTAGLDDVTTAMLDFTERLTREPASVGREDVERLRGAGLDDRAITDVVQVCAYFNYINRIADALGVEHEDFIDELGRPS